MRPPLILCENIYLLGLDKLNFVRRLNAKNALKIGYFLGIIGHGLFSKGRSSVPERAKLCSYCVVVSFPKGRYHVQHRSQYVETCAIATDESEQLNHFLTSRCR